MKIIKLTRGKNALVDKDVFERLSKHKWFFEDSGYPMTNIKEDGKWKKERMHYFIMEKKEGKIIDHINRNRLDNRKSNLRYATYSENFHNADISKRNKSGYKGVHWDKQSQKWRAMASVKGKQKHIGLYDCKKEAAKAYNDFVVRTAGEFAHLNDIQ